MQKLPDYERVLNLLKQHEGTYFPTYRIAELVGSQDNSVQRAINHNLKQYVESKQIVHRKHNGTQVNEYAWVVPGAGMREKRVLVWRQCETLCVCGNSKYAIIKDGKWVCNKCYNERE